MSGNLPIKYPSLRPRVFDPFLRDSGSTSATERTNSGGPDSHPFDDMPGAIAMYGPNARRTGGGDTYSVDNIEYDNATYDDDGRQDAVVVVPDEENGMQPPNIYPGYDTSNHSRSTSNFSKLEIRTRNPQLRITAGLVVFAMCVIFAIVIAVFLGASSDDDTDDDNVHSADTRQHNTQDYTSAKYWTLDADIVGTVNSFGFDVDFNHDGTIVAVSAPKAHNGRGQVEVYQRKISIGASTKESDAWYRLGQPIVGDKEGDYASWGMDLSLDGTHIAVGYPVNGNGFVRVFRLDARGEWEQQGQTLAGPSLMSKFGSSVSINNNGTLLVVGAPLAGDQEEGMVQVYQWNEKNNSSKWTEHGNAIYSDNPGDRFGTSVGISSDRGARGDVVVVGAPGDDSGWKDGGRIIFFEFQDQYRTSQLCDRPHGGCWRDMLGPDKPAITGGAEGNRLGQQLDLHLGGDSVISSSIPHINVYDQPSEEEEVQNEEVGVGLLALPPVDTIGVGRVRIMTIIEDKMLAEEIGVGICGSKDGEGLGYDVTFDANGLSPLIAATSVNNETYTGVARTYNFDGQLYAQRGRDVEPLPLGSNVWLGTGPENYAGPSVSLASPRVAIGYQSVVLENNQEVPGLVRILKRQPLTPIP